MSEKLCLKWNDFQENVKSAFVNFRGENDFSDVTLACTDGQQIEAHKVILAASSPFLAGVLKTNKHPHPKPKRNAEELDLHRVLGGLLICFR